MHKPLISSLLSLGITVGSLVGGPAIHGQSNKVNPLPPQQTAVYKEIRIKSGDTLWSLARVYETTVKALADVNRISNPNRLAVGDVIRVPVLKTGDRGTANRSARQVTVSRSRDGSALKRVGRSASPIPDQGWQELVAPVASARLSSGFGCRWGRMHWGLDMACPAGTTVMSVAAGRVIFAGWRSGYGWTIEIDHGGFRSLYAHNSKILVRVGQQVCAGEPIAAVGHTGHATGDHLHLELERGGVRVNPAKYFEVY